MATNTENLKLFKYDVEKDKKQTFNIKKSLNDNWDKIDESLALLNYQSDNVYKKGAWVVGTIDGKKSIYESLADDNINNILTNKTMWKKISLGSSGLELFDIGISLYINETKGLRRWLNGSIMDITSNYQPFLAGLKEISALYPSLVCTEDEWQAIKTASKVGQCGKFVYNYGSDGVTVTSIRLPAVVNINGLVDMAKAGLIKNESLPNITGKQTNVMVGPDKVNSGVFDLSSVKGISTTYGTITSPTIELNFDASRSSSTYQDNAPVQQEAIQYPYFIQVATGQETENNIVNSIESNNPFFFGKSEYFDEKPNNISWLKSEGQNNTKGTYPWAYNQILENVNKGTKKFKGKALYTYKGTTTETESYTPSCFTSNPVVGTWFYGYSPIQPCAYVTQVNTDGSIVVHDTKVNKDFTLVFKQEYATGDQLLTDYDFYIDTENETFRLPLKNGEENIPQKKYINDVIKNPISTTKQTYIAPAEGWFFAQVYYANSTGSFVVLVNGKFAYCQGDSTTNAFNNSAKVRVSKYDEITVYHDTSQATNQTTFFQYAQGNGSLYYYVGKTVQNDGLIDAGRIGEILPTKLDASKVKAYIVETYQNGNSGYILYSNKFCQQWGKPKATINGEQTITFLKPFADTNYVAFKNIGINSPQGTAGSNELCCYDFTTTTMKTVVNTDHPYSCWLAFGFIA